MSYNEKLLLKLLDFFNEVPAFAGMTILFEIKRLVSFEVSFHILYYFYNFNYMMYEFKI